MGLHRDRSHFQRNERKTKEAIIMGTNTPKSNRSAGTAAEQKLVDGLNKHAATIPSIVIAGASMTTKDIVATLQSRIDSANAALSTRATWQTAVQADQTERDKTKTFVSGLKQALLVAFAGQIDTLADFGLTGRKARVVSPEEKVAAAAKAKATRAARHTMGKVQKAAIKGTVAPTAPATAAPSAPTPIPTPPAAPAPAPLPPAPTQAAPVTPPVTPATPLAATLPATPAPASPVTTATPAAPVVPAPTVATAAPVPPVATATPAAPAIPVTTAHVG
jgi:hypothetical protein